MAPSRRQSNGRSPLVNQQRQITAFFSKSPSSTSSDQNPNKLSSPTNPKLKPNSSPIPSSIAKRSPSPSPTTPSPLQSKLKKPLLVIGASSSSPVTPASKKPYGEEVVGKRIKVYWPLDKSWYEGYVKSFDKDEGKHLVQYDDAEEEVLELAKEKIEWVEQSVTKLKRLRRGGSSLGLRKMVIEDDDDEVENLEDEAEGGADDDDDSSDEDWGKSGEKEVAENSEEEEDMEMEMEDEDEDEENRAVRSKGKPGGKGESKKRKIGGGKELNSAKKSKGSKDESKGVFKVSVMEPKENAESK